MKYNTLEVFNNGPLVILKLNRPEKKNALNHEMIEELANFYNSLKNNSEVVLLNIVAKGDVFCAGADIKWLLGMAGANENNISKNFSALGNMLNLLYNLPQITVAMVHGAAYGGGIGLMAACDYVICAPNTTFSFSEIKLGLVPATISPFVINRIGKSKAKKLFLTGQKFDENLAESIQLVDELAKPDLHAVNYQTMTEMLLTQPRNALKEMKKLFIDYTKLEITPESIKNSSNQIARLLKTEETQEIFNRFLNTN